MRQLRAAWGARSRTALEKQRLALASYNAGLGSILSAQRNCSEALLWDSIAPCLPAATGAANAKQTIDYVARIARLKAQLDDHR